MVHIKKKIIKKTKLLMAIFSCVLPSEKLFFYVYDRMFCLVPWEV